jgi:PAS domain-containing protein
MFKEIVKASFRRNLRWAIPLAYLIGFVIFDSLLLPSTSTAPTFAMAGLLVMALYLRPAEMIIWACIYSAIISVLLYPHLGKPTADETILPDLTPLFRMISFYIGAVMSCFFCQSLARQRVMYRNVTDILSSIPDPIITSDENGVILFSNEPARTLLALPEAHEKRKNYFDLLMPAGHAGKGIAEYLSRFEKEAPHSSMPLQFKDVPLKGMCKLIHSNGKKVLMTMLSREAP